MLEVLGRCTIDIEIAIHDIAEAIRRCNTDNTKYIWKHIYPIYHNADKDFSSTLDRLYNKTYSTTFFSTEDAIQRVDEKLREWYDDIEGETLKCYFSDDVISLVGPSSVESGMWMLPSTAVTLHPYKDYSHLSGQARKNLISDGSTELAVVDKSLAEVESDKAAVESQIDDLKSQMEDVKNAASGELAKLQAQIEKMQSELEAKKRELLDELEDKKYEMEQKLNQLQMTILRIDSEIYSIRCYTGEVIEMKMIREGRPASPSTPFVFYQKMKYLDEELGKLASIYRADFSDAKSFEELVKHRDDVLDSMIPAKRGMLLLRVSKSNTNFCKMPDRNILERYEKYRGLKVCMLIRDGERVFIAWTDDDRIYFSDDAFYRPGESEVADNEVLIDRRSFESDREYEKRMRNLTMKNIHESLGRAYVFALLQGIIDNSIIEFPEKVSVSGSKYIILNYAEGLLPTNAYGTFSDMIERCNRSVKVGDNILTTQSLRAEHCKYSTNDRGIGYANRTHDVYAEDCEVYPINLVLHYNKYLFTHPETERKYTSVCTKEEMERHIHLGYQAQLVEPSKTEYYISLHKTWSMSGNARANFLVYRDEFINLTFMNSVWLRYILMNHKADNMVIGGSRVDFAHVIPYINTALGFVETREHTVKSWLSRMAPEVLEDAEWPVKLSEWMLEHDVHNFSEFRTKQFVKSLQK